MATGKTFSESWHRVAGLEISLRPTVEVRKQYFRGEKWYVLEDPFNNQFFRLRPEAYDFVSRLQPGRTVEAVWEECLARRPDDAPGQDDAIQLLSQLYFANLLYFEAPGDSEKLFERYKQRRQREVRSKLLSIMFMRIPLMDPDYFLRRAMPLIRLLVSPLAAVVWLVVVGAAIKVAIDNFDAVLNQTQGILAPNNLALLYLGLVLIKTVHEFGHAIVCRRFGGEVHTMGLMLLVFTPLPYTDATSSWAFRSRWQRALVGAAGMIAELFVAALATFVWANTGAGTLNSLAYNMMFVASVSTVIFNANPLLRFDGYYILSDLLEIPNLSSRAFQQMRHVVERYLFGYRGSESPAPTLRESVMLVTFGVLSGIYKVIVFAGIVLFVADKLFLAGLVMAAVCVFAWLVVPLGRLVNHIATGPHLARTRARVAFVCLGTMGVVVGFLGLYPFPNHFRAPGVLEAVEYERVANDAPGYVESVMSPSGAWVRPGTALFQLSDPELQFEIDAALAERRESLVFLQRALSQQAADVEPIRKRLETIEQKLADLEETRSALLVTAHQAGVWVAPEEGQLVGAWIPRGSVLGEIVNTESLRFAAAVLQDEAANMFAEGIRNAEIRLRGQGEMSLPVRTYLSIPFEHTRLPSPALGWRGGGDVPVALSDETGLLATEPFFQIYAYLDPVPDVTYLHGRSGQLRFTLEPQPLLQQWIRKFRRLLQKRYQI